MAAGPLSKKHRGYCCFVAGLSSPRFFSHQHITPFSALLPACRSGQPVLSFAKWGPLQNASSTVFDTTAYGRAIYSIFLPAKRRGSAQ
jgi:hypothetical protein